MKKQRNKIQNNIPCTSTSDSIQLNPKNYFDFDVTRHKADIIKYFRNDLLKDDAVTMVEGEDVIKRFKEAQKSNFCKCSSCVVKRRNFDLEIKTVIKILHSYLAACDANKAECKANAKNENIERFSCKEDQWDSFEDYWFDCIEPEEEFSFSISKNVLKNDSNFGMFLDYFPVHNLLNDFLYDFDVEESCIGGILQQDLSVTAASLCCDDCVALFDDDDGYSDVECEEDLKSDPKSRESSSTTGRDTSIAEKIENNLVLVVSCIGLILFERILHLYRDKLAKDSREKLLLELAMEKNNKVSETESKNENKGKKNKGKNKKKGKEYSDSSTATSPVKPIISVEQKTEVDLLKPRISSLENSAVAHLVVNNETVYDKSKIICSQPLQPVHDYTGKQLETPVAKINPNIFEELLRTQNEIKIQKMKEENNRIKADDVPLSCAVKNDNIQLKSINTTKSNTVSPKKPTLSPDIILKEPPKSKQEVVSNPAKGSQGQKDFISPEKCKSDKKRNSFNTLSPDTSLKESPRTQRGSRIRAEDTPPVCTVTPKKSTFSPVSCLNELANAQVESSKIESFMKQTSPLSGCQEEKVFTSHEKNKPVNKRNSLRESIYEEEDPIVSPSLTPGSKTPIGSRKPYSPPSDKFSNFGVDMW